MPEQEKRIIANSTQTAVTDYLIENIQGKPTLRVVNRTFFEGDLSLEERAEHVQKVLSEKIDSCFNVAIALAACFKLNPALASKVIFLLRGVTILSRPETWKFQLYQGSVFGVLQGVLFLTDEDETTMRKQILQFLQVLLLQFTTDLPVKVAPEHMKGLHTHLSGAFANIVPQLIKRRSALIKEFRSAIRASLGNTDPLLGFQALIGITTDILAELYQKEEGTLNEVDRLDRSIEWPSKPRVAVKVKPT